MADEEKQEAPVDVSMAIRLDDLKLLECGFSCLAPMDGATPHMQLVITNPDVQFDLDVRARRTVCHSTVVVRFGLFDPDAPGATPEQPLEFVRFGFVAGAVTTVPFMGEAPAAARHMAGVEGAPEAVRDKKMEHMLRLEAIKAVHAHAQAKLAELSALSPTGLLMLPLVDADELLLDIEKKEAAK